MKRTYTSYVLTLISAFVVYFTFGLMSSVAAGYTWIPLVAFLTSIVHFGISSWLFLQYPKTGKIISIITATIMCLWPVTAFIGSLIEREWIGAVIYSIPILFSILLIYNHIKTFKLDTKPEVIVRLIMITVPLGFFIYYIIYIMTMIRTGQIIIR